MPHTKQTHAVNTAYIESISELCFDSEGETLMQPDGCWDIAILRRGDDVQVLRTGLTTRAVRYEHSPGDRTLVISFRPNAFMPLMPGELMRDEGVLLEKFGPNSFWIGTDVREIPNLENADVFVERLVRQEIVQSSDVVASILDGHPRAMSERTMQRHFLKTTGLTYKSFTLVERAQKAVSLLRMGRPHAEVALALGYSDQAHMINSLKAIMGQTPGQIVRAPAG